MTSEQPSPTISPAVDISPSTDEFDLEVVVGNVDIYDDLLSGDTIAARTDASLIKSTRTSTSQYPLSLKNDNGPPESIESTTTISRPEAPKFQCLIGNLTWWTTDADIKAAIESLGVFDCVEISFFENRLTGVSRGFCCCIVQSDGSLKLIHENLIHEEVHGKRLQVMHNTKDAIAYFESQDIFRPKTDPSSQQHDDEKENLYFAPGMRPSGQAMFAPRFPPRYPPGCSTQQCYYNPNSAFRMFPPNFRYRGHFPGFRGPMNGRGHRITQPSQYRPWHESYPPRGRQEGYFTQEHQQRKHFSPPIVTPPGISSPPLAGHFPPLASSSPIARIQPQPHFNPDFLRRGCFSDVQLSPVKNPQLPTESASVILPNASKSPQKLSPEEYEAAMAKVKTVASAAMTRAVKDVASGDYADSIETLVTAISLLRQSKVVNDNSVKMLIATLRDTLEGVEVKSYSSSKRGRTHSRRHYRDDYYRERSRSPRSRDKRDNREHYSTEHSRGDYKRAEVQDEYVPRMFRDHQKRSRSPGEARGRHCEYYR